MRRALPWVLSVVVLVVAGREFAAMSDYGLALAGWFVGAVTLFALALIWAVHFHFMGARWPRLVFVVVTGLTLLGIVGGFRNTLARIIDDAPANVSGLFVDLAHRRSLRDVTFRSERLGVEFDYRSGGWGSAGTPETYSVTETDAGVVFEPAGRGLLVVHRKAPEVDFLEALKADYGPTCHCEFFLNGVLDGEQVAPVHLARGMVFAIADSNIQPAVPTAKRLTEVFIYDPAVPDRYAAVWFEDWVSFADGAAMARAPKENGDVVRWFETLRFIRERD